MVFQDKINVSPAVQFTITVSRTLVVKYVNRDDSCIYNKHAQAENKGSHVEKKTEIEADSYI